MAGRVGRTISMQSTIKLKAPIPQPQVCVSPDLGGGLDQSRLHAGGVKNHWVGKNHHTRRATEDSNIGRTLLKDEHVQEREE